MSENKRDNRKVQRVFLEAPIRVVMGSIGNSVRYELQSQSVSTNGFFLSFEKPGRFPFTASSIMEVWLEISDTEKVFFNGKMARVVMPSDVKDKRLGAGIAIRIVQIDRENEDRLRSFIENTAGESNGGKKDNQVA